MYARKLYKIYLQSNLYLEVTFETKKKWPYKSFNSYEIFWQENGDLLIQVTT
jgi:hypothetical protein